MDTIIIFAVMVAAAVFFPYIRFGIKRIIAVKSIKKSCAVNRYKFHRVHSFSAVSRRKSSKCDFYIEKSDEILAVKFFGDPHRGRKLIICHGNEYFYRRHSIFCAFGSIFRYDTDLPRRTIPKYNFSFKHKTGWDTKRVREILLIHPYSGEVYFIPSRGGERKITSGEIIHGMEILTLSHITNPS